jgi:predicted enzyme related to lactoylglutathione lyase
LFGWKAEEPSSEFGGYFMFTRDGVPIAGGMGDMGDLKANNAWQIYLAAGDIAKTVEAAGAAGAQVVSPPMEVADLGIQSVLVDPTGAGVGVWQPGTFPGFTVIGEPGAPSWFELQTHAYDDAVGFYRSVFGWDTNVMSDTAELRYTTMRGPSGQPDQAGIMDASHFAPDGTTSAWSVYWMTDDVDASVSKVRVLGGSVLQEPQDTPYGRLAAVTDSTGSEFKLHTPVG